MIDVEHYFGEDGKRALDTKKALRMVRWSFTTDTRFGGEVTLRIASYTEFSRETPKHKFRRDHLRWWGLHSERECRMRAADVPVPYAVQREAASMITFRFEPWANMAKAEVGPLGGIIAR
jgi:hypothetical protein